MVLVWFVVFCLDASKRCFPPVKRICNILLHHRAGSSQLSVIET